MNPRRGNIYFLVLAVCLLVGMIGLGAVLAARAQIRSVGQTADFDEARLYARSGIELGTWLANQSNFRNTYSNGSWIARQKLGSGVLSISGNNVNPALPLNNSDTDPVVVTAIGYKGIAVHETQVQLVAKPQALTCLPTCADFGGGVTLGALLSTVTLTCNQPFSTNGNLSAVQANMTGPLEYAGSLSIGLLCSGSFTTTHIAPRGLPDPNHVFDYYKSHGTPIAISSLYSASLGGYAIQNCLLSPGNNPFGPTDPQGIYIVDCGSLGNTITIQNCRIVGTLVILNAGAGSSVAGSVNWAPAVSNYPCLLVQSAIGSSFALQYTNAAISESSIGVNLNPPSTPYNGISNTTTTDAYPSVIAGLVYCSGALSVANYVTIKGVLVVNGGLTWTSGTMSLTWDNLYSHNPPPGFYQTPVPMVVVSGSLAQVVN